MMTILICAPRVLQQGALAIVCTTYSITTDKPCPSIDEKAELEAKFLASLLQAKWRKVLTNLHTEVIGR